MLIKTARLIIVIAASLFLLFASVQLLYAQSDVRPPVPVVYEQDENRYSLDYFLPYAKSILVNHTYRNGGGILAVVYQELFPLAGVNAVYTFENASELESIQVIVRLHDERSFTLTPIRIGLNRNYLPIVQQDGLPNNAESELVDGGIIVFEDAIQVAVLLHDYDRMFIQLNDADGNAFYKIWNTSDYDEKFPTDEVFGYAFGYVWDLETLKINPIRFEVIHVEVTK